MEQSVFGLYDGIHPSPGFGCWSAYVGGIADGEEVQELCWAERGRKKAQTVANGVFIYGYRHRSRQHRLECGTSGEYIIAERGVDGVRAFRSFSKTII